MKTEEMLWMGKRNFTQKARSSQRCDVSIKKSYSQEKLKVRFTFRNGSGGIVSETEYLQFAVPDSKHIYFTSGDHDTGLKLSSQKSMCCDNRYVMVNKESDAEEIVSFVGDYNLKYDDECGLYYIQR